MCQLDTPEKRSSVEELPPSDGLWTYSQLLTHMGVPSSLRTILSFPGLGCKRMEADQARGSKTVSSGLCFKPLL